MDSTPTSNPPPNESTSGGRTDTQPVIHATQTDIPVSKVADPNVTPGKCPHTSKRNLVVCIDGTANKYSDKITNVIQLYSRLEKSPDQRTYYNSGIGTYAEPARKTLYYPIQVINSKVDLVIAWRFDHIIRKAYHWLSENYEDGDCIFLFGFSRGAFQVRALSAMISKVGLIHKGNQEQIPFAYELYNNAHGEDINHKIQYFKNTFSHDVKVHFVGAWDTVSSIGITRGTRAMPDTTTGMKHVCRFRHALALDERRVKFLPEYAYGTPTLSQEEKSNPERQAETPDTIYQPHIKEVWFAGTHSDIGGGNRPIDLGDPDPPASIPLQWMMYEALSAGLKVKTQSLKMPDWNKVLDVNESLTGFWRLLEIVPIKQAIYANTTHGAQPMKFGIHRGRGRQIQVGQKIHLSLESVPSTYKPKAIPPKPHISIDNILPPPPNSEVTFLATNTNRWKVWKAKLMRSILHCQFTDPPYHAHDANEWDNWKEDDVWARANIIIKDIKNTMPMPNQSTTEPIDYEKLRNILQHLDDVLDGDRGHRAISEVFEAKILLILAMNTVKETQPDDIKSLFIIVTALSNFPVTDFSLPQYELLTSFLAMSETSKSHKTNLKKIVEQLYPRKNIFIPSPPVHSGYVWSVAFSPDGKRIVSGSADHTVCVWDTATGALVLEPIKGHDGEVNAVAYSSPEDPQNQLIASASDDKTIRVWNAKTGKIFGEPLKGHTELVRSVAFSSDGERIVSGSNDCTVRVWETPKTGSKVSEPLILEGHTDVVISVAFSKDGKRIVSGSLDHTIRIWDTQKGVEQRAPLNHTSAISSVAFSPLNDRHIVSGSYDNTIQIWNTEEGENISRPLKGHTDDINSVAYSFNGKYIVSGSDDHTIIIWDAKSGSSLSPLTGHQRGVLSVAFSPDNKHIVSGSTDGTIRLWDAKTGRSVNPLEPDVAKSVASKVRKDAGVLVSSSGEMEAVQSLEPVSASRQLDDAGSQTETAM